MDKNETADTKGTQEKIDELFFNFANFLKEKNRRYGDSALNALKIFSKHEPDNPICSRLDEKLQRVLNADQINKNDVSDIFGYLSLYLIGKNWLTFDEFID